MPVSSFEIETPVPVSLALTVASHGWAWLSPWHWDAETEILSRAEMLPSGEVVRVRASQSSPGKIAVSVEGNDIQEATAARGIVGRWLSLDWSPAKAIEKADGLDSRIAGHLREGGGRMLRGSTFYEDLLKTICTIQISWAGTGRMVNALIELSTDSVFPKPSQILEIGEAGLRNETKLGFRAPVVIEATRSLLDDGLMDEHGRGDDSQIAYDYLIGIRGIGPYAASHLAVLLHDFRRIPVDSAVSKYCLERFGIAPGEVDGHFDTWGDLRFLGYRLDRLVWRSEGDGRS